jgi:hypothetical protein
MRYIAALLSALSLYGIASAENLVMYHKDKTHLHYYDKSSIIFPTDTMASNPSAKSIIDLWEIRKSLSTGHIRRTEKVISCTTRRITTKNIIENGKHVYTREAYKTVPIKYDSADYHLYKEFCINMK